MTTRIKLRRDTAANWTANNPILALGEPGLETDTLQVKYGDGVTAWNTLNYSASSGGDTNEAVFAALSTSWDFSTAKSTNGTNWTADHPFDINLQQSLGYGFSQQMGWGTNMVDMAIGAGCVVYIDWSPWMGNFGIWRATNLDTYPTEQTVSMTMSSFTAPYFEWRGVEYLGGYFIAYGTCYDDGAPNPSTPIFAYSTDGINWTQGSINKTYTDSIYSTAHGDNSSIFGLQITGVAYNGTGWLFNLDYGFYGGTLNGESLPGGFYVTDLTTTLGAANFDQTPGSGYADNQAVMTWTGNRWVIADNDYDSVESQFRSYIWYNTSANPRDGTWTSINMVPIILNKFGFEYSDWWNTGANPVLAVAGGTIGGTVWTVLGLGEGQMLSTADFITWYAATPAPITYTITDYTWTDPGTTVSLDWTLNSVDPYGNNTTQRLINYQGKVTIATLPGHTSPITPGTYYASNIGNTVTLYTDEARTVPLDTSSGWGAYSNGSSTLTYHRGWAGIEQIIIGNSIILAANYDGFIFKNTSATLASAFTEVKFGWGNNINRLAYGTLTQLGNSWEATHAASNHVNKAVLSDRGFSVIAGDNYTQTGIFADAAHFEMATRTPYNAQWSGGEFGGNGSVTQDAYTGIYNDDWINEGDGPNLDIVIDVPRATHVFDRYGNIRLAGPIIHYSNSNYADPPIDSAVNSSNFTTAAQNIRNLRNDDPEQTDWAEGWPAIVYIDSSTYNGTSVKHYYLPPGPDWGTEITFLGKGSNLQNVRVWIQAAQIGGSYVTNTYWFPFVVWNSGGFSYRNIAKAIYFDNAWHFDNDAWED